MFDCKMQNLLVLSSISFRSKKHLSASIVGPRHLELVILLLSIQGIPAIPPGVITFTAKYISFNGVVFLEPHSKHSD